MQTQLHTPVKHLLTPHEPDARESRPLTPTSVRPLSAPPTGEKFRRMAHVGFLLASLALVACSSTGDDDSPVSTPTPGATPTATPTTTSDACTCAHLYETVFPTYCGSGETGGGCHVGSNPDGNLNLLTSDCSTELINAAPDNSVAAGDGLKRVVPGSLEQSYLWKKVAAGLDGLPEGYGGTMPPNIRALPEDALQSIQCWIEGGAPLSRQSQTHP